MASAGPRFHEGTPLDLYTVLLYPSGSGAVQRVSVDWDRAVTWDPCRSWFVYEAQIAGVEYSLPEPCLGTQDEAEGWLSSLPAEPGRRSLCPAVSAPRVPQTRAPEPASDPGQDEVLRARELITQCTSMLLGLTQQQASASNPSITELAATRAATRLAASISAGLLPVEQQTLFFSTFVSDLLLPIYSSNQYLQAAVKRCWAIFELELQRSPTARGGLIPQLQFVLDNLPHFDQQVQEQADRLSEAATRSSVSSLLQSQQQMQQQMQLQLARQQQLQQQQHLQHQHQQQQQQQTFRQPAPATYLLNQPAEVLPQGTVAEAKRKAMEGQPGCEYWSGVDGSCFKKARCPDFDSHVPGIPSARFQAKDRALRGFGYQPDHRGCFHRSTSSAPAPSTASAAGGTQQPPGAS